MEIFESMGRNGHEQVLFCHEPAANYRGIIVIHNTTLGPALGGTRFWNYQSDHEALTDALRLARGMTYKAAAAGLNLGGGKAVIIGDNRLSRREALFRAHGRFVETLKGRYITAEDVGVSVEDMDYVLMETEHVAGIASRSGDPSPVTAYGVLRAMQAAARLRFDTESLDGMRIAIQGLGHVGYQLCHTLSREGARLIVTDIDQERVQQVVDEFGAESVRPDDIYGVEAEIYAPCALGSTINDQTIPKFRCEIIAGSANNQLAEVRHGDELTRRGIIYAPDYVINAGGLINVYGELHGWSGDQAIRKTGEIYETLGQLFEIARDEGISTSTAADRLAERRIEEVARLHRTWV